VVPGFVETPESLKSFITSLAQAGERTTIAVDHNRREALPETAGTPYEHYAPEHMARAQDLLTALEGAGLEQADLVAHSQGCVDAVVAAMLDAEAGTNRIRNLVLVNPGGASGPQSKAGAGLRAGQEMMKEFGRGLRKPSSLPGLSQIARNAAGYVADNPRRAYSEASATLQANILDDLEVLREKYGLQVAIVASVDDYIMQMDKFQAAVKNHHIDGFYSIKGGHNELILDSERQGTVIASILSDLAKKREPTS
jgi:pimeloyl-ACP methyl ester carboxylesterase